MDHNVLQEAEDGFFFVIKKRKKGSDSCPGSTSAHLTDDYGFLFITIKSRLSPCTVKE